MDTYDDATRRFASVEGILGGGRTQSVVHDQNILIVENGVVHRFIVFFKNHIGLPANLAIPYGVWRGDVVVMRRSADGGYLNIRADDRMRIDFAVEKYVLFARPVLFLCLRFS